MIEVEGEEREFRTGDRVAIEPGTRHRDPWNPSAGELHVRGHSSPTSTSSRPTRRPTSSPDRGGRLNDQDELPLLQIFVISKATDGRSSAATPAVGIQKGSLAAAGRRRPAARLQAELRLGGCAELRRGPGLARGGG